LARVIRRNEVDGSGTVLDVETKSTFGNEEKRIKKRIPRSANWVYNTLCNASRSLCTVRREGHGISRRRRERTTVQGGSNQN